MICKPFLIKRSTSLFDQSHGKVAIYQSSVHGNHYAIKSFHKSHLRKLRVAPSETSMTDVLHDERKNTCIETGDFLLADADIKKSLELHPQNREVKVMKMKLKQLQADGDKKDAKLYENMFASKPKVVEIGKGS
ncbi:calcium/calmodulin-dependent protein kinase [Trifolium repens]|nr:calcium/calmodulin-dependent protein kinase [Trifolium repens]WJX14412.1 calcium/calmodulin-dependent protein kinase [Trifolium repens]